MLVYYSTQQERLEITKLILQISAAKHPDFVRYHVSAWRKYKGVPRERPQQKKFHTVSAKSAWEQAFKDEKMADSWFLPIWV